MKMSAKNGKDLMDGIYHETQVRELCALHSLNNVLQRRQFSERQLHDICERLAPTAWLNPHRSPLGTGNFDINVLLTALQHTGRDACWLDRRRSVSSLVLDKIDGFILNLSTEFRLGPFTLPFSRRHWIALRRLAPCTQTSSGNPAYYNLDSKLAAPLRIGSEDAFLEYLSEKLRDPDVEAFAVVSQQVASDGAWTRAAPADRQSNSQCETPSLDGSPVAVRSGAPLARAESQVIVNDEAENGFPGLVESSPVS